MNLHTSAEIGKLATALAKAQGAMAAATKDATNPHFRSRYADLASIMAACREQLSANSIAVVQAPAFADGWASVTTRLIHSSGEWMEGSLCARPRKDDPQSIGSAITYLRRYTLAALVGVVSDDDDGNAASAEGPRTPSQSAPHGHSGHRGPSAPSHHPSWAADRSRFCAWAGNASELFQGSTYDLLADFCAVQDWGRPSGWAQEQRDAFRADKDKWLESYIGFVDNVEKR